MQTHVGPFVAALELCNSVIRGKFKTSLINMSSAPVIQLETVAFVKNDFKKKKQSDNLQGSTSHSTLTHIDQPACSFTVTVVPIVVDFERLLKSSSTLPKQLFNAVMTCGIACLAGLPWEKIIVLHNSKVVSGIDNVDLLHGVANLYSVSLPEVTDDIIYPTLCEKWSKTLLLLRDEDEVIEELKTRRSYKKSVNYINPASNNAASTDGDAQSHTLSIFSDSDVSEADEGDDDDAEFMSQIPDFIRKVENRQSLRKRFCDEQGNQKCTATEPPSQIIGIENRLVACATFERSYEIPGQRVLQLTLIAVRKKYRHLGIGHFMVQQLHDSTVTGGRDVIIVNADHNAVEFFEKQGFSGDVLLNSPYAQIGEVWLNSKRMCFIPSYTSSGDSGESTSDDLFPPELGLKEMELELALWREKSLQAYQAQAFLVRRMRQEILALRARVAVQDDVIMKLRAELEAAQDANVTKQEESLRKRLRDLKKAMVNLENETKIEDGSDVSSSAEDNGSATSSYKQLTEVEKQFDSYKRSSAPQEESGTTVCRNDCLPFSEITTKIKQDDLAELTLKEITHCFVSSMDSGEYTFSGTAYLVTKVIDTIPAAPSVEAVLKYEERIKTCQYPEMVANLYFCPAQSCTTVDRFMAVLSKGFSSGDFVESEYGVALHFTRHARAAARFSPAGKILVAKVCLGNVLTAKTSHRTECPKGFDSVLTQGRLASSEHRPPSGIAYSHSWNAGCSEYLVFHPHQALPLALIEYSLIM